MSTHLVNSQRFGVAAGGDSPGTTNLEWWFDFTANGDDSHTGGYDLPVVDDGTADSFTYSDGRVTGTQHIRFDGPTNMDAFLDDSTQAATLACRFVLNSSWSAAAADLGYPVHGTNGQAYLRVISGTNTRLRLGNVGGDLAVTFAANDVIMMVIRYNGSDTWKYEVWQNGTKISDTSTGTYSETGVPIGLYVLRGATTFGMENTEVDWVAGWSEELTDDEVTWLYNSGNTRTYADL